jgi:pimeloyl-ACP methyl ester carboxylesterase
MEKDVAPAGARTTTAKLTRGSMLRRMGVGAGTAVAASTLAFTSPAGVVQAAGAAARGTRLSKKPTIILVHGAFAESASWNGSLGRLLDQGFPTIAAAVPLRSIAGDTVFLSAIVKSIKGPVVLVGHSYGGAVISSASAENTNVKALVFVSGLAPEPGEKLGALVSRFPGSTLTPTLSSVPLADGSNDLYIQQDKYHQQFMADVPIAVAALGAVTQRPIRDYAFNEPSGAAGWKLLPSWFIYAELDKNIPAAVHRFMAERAGAREVVEIKGAAHALPVSQPDAVTDLILKATAYVESIG